MNLQRCCGDSCPLAGRPGKTAGGANQAPLGYNRREMRSNVLTSSHFERTWSLTLEQALLQHPELRVRELARRLPEAWPVVPSNVGRASSSSWWAEHLRDAGRRDPLPTGQLGAAPDRTAFDHVPPLALDHPHQRGAQKREPLGVRSQRLSPCSGRETPDVNGMLGQCRRFVKRLRSSSARSWRENLFEDAVRARCAYSTAPAAHPVSRLGESHPPQPWAKDG